MYFFVFGLLGDFEMMFRGLPFIIHAPRETGGGGGGGGDHTSSTYPEMPLFLLFSLGFSPF